MKFEIKPLKILDFDIETRPLSWIGGDYCSRDITAIAAGTTTRDIECRTIDAWPRSTVVMLEWFKKLYDEADIVTGHYIRKYDLPNINGAMLDFGLQPLGPKYVSDTKEDLVKRDGISASQESLAAMFGLKQPKRHMTQEEWRQSNRLLRTDLTFERVTQDVKQHIALRKKLIEVNALSPPRVWHPKVRY